MKWYCKSGLLGLDIYRHTHTHTHTHTTSKEHTSPYIHVNASRQKSQKLKLSPFIRSFTLRTTAITCSNPPAYTHTGGWKTACIHTHTHTQTHGIVNQGMLNQCQNSINSPLPCGGTPLLLLLLFHFHSSSSLLSISCHLSFLCLPYHFLSWSSSSFNLPYGLKLPRGGTHSVGQYRVLSSW